MISVTFYENVRFLCDMNQEKRHVTLKRNGIQEFNRLEIFVRNFPSIFPIVVIQIDDHNQDGLTTSPHKIRLTGYF